MLWAWTAQTKNATAGNVSEKETKHNRQGIQKTCVCRTGAGPQTSKVSENKQRTHQDSCALMPKTGQHNRHTQKLIITADFVKLKATSQTNEMVKPCTFTSTQTSCSTMLRPLCDLWQQAIAKMTQLQIGMGSQNCGSGHHSQKNNKKKWPRSGDEKLAKNTRNAAQAAIRREEGHSPCNDPGHKAPRRRFHEHPKTGNKQTLLDMLWAWTPQKKRCNSRQCVWEGNKKQQTRHTKNMFLLDRLWAANWQRFWKQAEDTPRQPFLDAKNWPTQQTYTNAHYCYKICQTESNKPNEWNGKTMYFYIHKNLMLHNVEASVWSMAAGKCKNDTIADWQGLAKLWFLAPQPRKSLPRTPGILSRLPSEERRGKAFAMTLGTRHQEGSSMKQNTTDREQKKHVFAGQALGLKLPKILKTSRGHTKTALPWCQKMTNTTHTNADYCYKIFQSESNKPNKSNGKTMHFYLH
jgi:hypothetical protein